VELDARCSDLRWCVGLVVIDGASELAMLKR